MGGKVWSRQEERYFWRNAITRSARRVGTDRARQEQSWAELARNMQSTLGDDARRQYTGTMLFEHYFQNIESKRVSPNAARYVREYLEKIRPRKEHPLLKASHLGEQFSNISNLSYNQEWTPVIADQATDNAHESPKPFKSTDLTQPPFILSTILDQPLLTVEFIEDSMDGIQSEHFRHPRTGLHIG